MGNSMDALQEFRANGAHELLDLLKTRKVPKDVDAESVVYGLVEIAESVEKV